MKIILTSASVIILALSMICCNSKAKSDNKQNDVENDAIEVLSGKIIPADTYGEGENKLYVTLVGHGSLMFEYKGKIIHVDPYSNVADYSKLPKADLILLTHEHGDHLDQSAINELKTTGTQFIMSRSCNDILKYGEVINNGEYTHFEDIYITAIPAYNIVHKKPDGEAYHPKGRGNGYLLRFGDLSVYVAGDTENIPEMDSLKGTIKERGQIDIAFMPKNLPYTMTDEMFIDAAKKVMPEHLYPYHMSEFDNDIISKALEGTNIKLEVRPMSNK